MFEGISATGEGWAQRHLLQAGDLLELQAVTDPEHHDLPLFRRQKEEASIDRPMFFGSSEFIVGKYK